MGHQPSSGLVRGLGRWTLTALVINSIVGSGIFGLPSVVASYVGSQSPFAYLIASVAIGVIIACFAEVASQFGSAGGPYIYASESFGRFLGIETGWLLWLVRLTAAAAAANLFTNYLGEFWSGAESVLPRLAIITLLIGFLAIVNVYGVKSGALVSNIFTVSKLVPLVAFAVGGIIFVLQGRTSIPPVTAAAATFPIRNWLEAVLVLMFAYGGFEGAVIPMGEATNPEKDVPFALFAGLLTTTLLYSAIQFVVIHTVPAAASTNRPLAVAAYEMIGPAGARLISIGALISLYGYLSAQMLHTPRLTFALGERGDFPRWFARVHSRFHTPYISIVIFAAIIWSLAAVGNFKWNVILSSIGRLFIYGITCASLPILRRKHPESRSFRIPGGDFIAALGIAFMLALLSRIGRYEGVAIVLTMAIALANWRWARGRNGDT